MTIYTVHRQQLITPNNQSKCFELLSNLKLWTTLSESNSITTTAAPHRRRSKTTCTSPEQYQDIAMRNACDTTYVYQPVHETTHAFRNIDRLLTTFDYPMVTHSMRATYNALLHQQLLDLLLVNACARQFALGSEKFTPQVVQQIGRPGQ